VAIAERIGFTWDRRDNPFGATQGTLIAAGVEHVRADPVGEQCIENPQDDPFAAACSQFLRWTNRIAGYVRLSEKGLALAMSYRWGYNQQLITGSRTYPDRLFFLGGVDSIRGYLQDSLVPQDIADQLLAEGSTLSLNQVLVRGGDIFVNPRAELRIPLSTNVQTALFVDAGNLWTDPDKLNAFDLRYAAGTGIRIATPIGPLVFDYGFNIDRVLDKLDPNRKDQRFWEELGAFHFSIGLF
jgi:outer membrane protein assembly factor BamA